MSEVFFGSDFDQLQASDPEIAAVLLDELARLRGGLQLIASENFTSPAVLTALAQAARAWALLDARKHVVPEDVQAVLPGVVGHRLSPTGVAREAAATSKDIAARLIASVAIP